MKKIFLGILALCSFVAVSAQVTLVEWNFPNNPDDAVADAGIPANTSQTISTVGGTGVLDFATAGATTNSGRATGWNAGAGVKYWQVQFSTTGYQTLTLSSKQRSSNSGPANFSAEYSTDGATWTAISPVTVADNFTLGVLSNVALPASLDNLPTVYIRYVMVNDISVNAGTVASTGSSRIDDLKITGVSLITSTCVINSVTAANPSACDPLTDTYSVAVTVTSTDAPAGGNLIVNGQSFPVTTSPQTVTLTGLPSDGMPVDVTAYYDLDPACTFTAPALFSAPASCYVPTPGLLTIVGVVDGPLTGGTPKAIELYATADIPDLSLYGLQSVNTAGTYGTQEFTFPAGSASAGDCIFVATDSLNFHTFFGFAPTYVNGVSSINGDDAILLYFNGTYYDVYGDPDLDGTSTAWDYVNGWAYRIGTGPEYPFNVGNWSVNKDALITGVDTTNAIATLPYPNCTYGGSCVDVVSLVSPGNDITDVTTTEEANMSLSASNLVSFTAASSNTVIYQAGDYVSLLPGFRATAAGTAQFVARIAACGTAKNGTTPSVVAAVSKEIALWIAPNPADYETNISFQMEGEQVVSLDLFDLQGKKVQTIFNGISNSQQITLSTSNLMSGIYLVRLTTAQGISKTTKLMIR